MIRQSLYAVFLAAVLSTVVQAEQSEKFGDYTVHYVAFTTDHLTPEVAKLYRIPRSENRVLVNISVLKNEIGISGKPVKARVHGTVKNLSEQLRQLNIREIDEESAVYYIAETPVNNEEILIYNFEITPEGVDETYKLTFKKEF